MFIKNVNGASEVSISNPQIHSGADEKTAQIEAPISVLVKLDDNRQRSDQFNVAPANSLSALLQQAQLPTMMQQNPAA